MEKNKSLSDPAKMVEILPSARLGPSWFGVAHARYDDVVDDSIMVVVVVAVVVVRLVVVLSIVVVVWKEAVLVTADPTAVAVTVGLVVDVTVDVDVGSVLVDVGLTATSFLKITTWTVLMPGGVSMSMS